MKNMLRYRQLLQQLVSRKLWRLNKQICLLNDDELAESLSLIRNHGLSDRDSVEVLGVNGWVGGSIIVFAILCLELFPSKK